jgi:hypothetical protein
MLLTLLIRLLLLPLSRKTLDTLSDPNWVNVMHEDLENLERNQVWELVEPPPNCKPIGTKCGKTKRVRLVRW